MVVQLNESTKRLIDERVSMFKNGLNSFDSYFKTGEVRNAVDQAVQLKRNGNLEAANDIYMRVVREDGFDSGVIWGWIKVMLLAKNFVDAQLLLRYEHAMLVRYYQLDEYHPNNTLEFYKETQGKGFPMHLTYHGDTRPAPPVNYDVADTISWYDLLSTFTFRPFSYLTAKAVINLGDKREVEEKITAFGGSAYWNRYFLSEGEYRDFLMYFGSN